MRVDSGSSHPCRGGVGRISKEVAVKSFDAVPDLTLGIAAYFLDWFAPNVTGSLDTAHTDGSEGAIS